MVYLEDHGKLILMLLDIVEVAQSHTGVVLGETFVEVLKAFGIEKKSVLLAFKPNAGYSLRQQVLSITVDNASNNDTIFTYLGRVLLDFPRTINQT